MSSQTHTSDSRILGRRTLERDHRRLAELLKPGMAVLDVGCGNGAITAGIARAVGTAGSVLGIDCDSTLLEEARARFSGLANLRFEKQDILTFDARGRFDIASAARTLQWISRPEEAVERMKSAVKPGGFVVALDYNHTQVVLEPPPPSEFWTFYDAFLRWRELNSWDNRMGDRLQALLEGVGLQEIAVWVEDESASVEEPAFKDAVSIWGHVIETLGPQVTLSGLLTEEARLEAAKAFEDWAGTKARRQTLVLRAARGKVI
jgi:SAM-dependent methyltransferase